MKSRSLLRFESTIKSKVNVIHLKNTKNPNSVKPLFFGVKHFFVMNRIPLDWEIISKMFPETRKTTGNKAWTTRHVQKILESCKTKLNVAQLYKNYFNS